MEIFFTRLASKPSSRPKLDFDSDFLRVLVISAPSAAGVEQTLFANHGEKADPGQWNQGGKNRFRQRRNRPQRKFLSCIFPGLLDFFFHFACNWTQNPSQVISSSLFVSIQHFLWVKIRAFLHELTNLLPLF